MRLVLDTDVMVAAVRSPSGASAEILRRILRGEWTMLASVPLFLEYEAVLTRAEHLEAAGAMIEDVCNLLDVLAGVIEPVEIRFLWRPQLMDVDDDMVLECAVNGRTDVLTTFNVADFEPASSRFGVRAVRPADVLRARRA